MQAAERSPAANAVADPILLRVENVYKYFPVSGIGGDSVHAVDGVDLEIRRGELRHRRGLAGRWRQHRRLMTPKRIPLFHARAASLSNGVAPTP